MKWTSFSKNQKLPKLAQGEMDNLNSLITIKSNWIHNQKPYKNQMVSLAKSTKYLKKKSVQHSLFHKIEEEEALHNSFYEAGTDTKTRLRQYQKSIFQTKILMEHQWPTQKSPAKY